MPSRFGALLCLGLAAPTAVAADDLVQQVRDGRRAARESIRTFTATVKHEQTHPKPQVLGDGRYVRSGDMALIREGQEGKHTSDVLIKPGEILRLGRNWAKGKSLPTGVAFRDSPKGPSGFCDVWVFMMIETHEQGGDRPHGADPGSIRADRNTLDGRECVRLRYTITHAKGSTSRYTQWHDVGRNYLIIQAVSEYTGGDSAARRFVVRATEFIEPSPGVVFPTRVTRDAYREGELDNAAVVTLADVVINQPVPASAFALPAVPAGTKLMDRIDNKEGPIDSNWKPAGEMKPLPPPPTSPPEHPPPPKPQWPTPLDTTPSAAEPVSSARWVIGGSVAVLLVAAVLAVVRRVWVSRRTATA